MYQLGRHPDELGDGPRSYGLGFRSVSQSIARPREKGSRGGWTDLFTCCPPGPLDRANVVLPLGSESSLTLWRHFLASDKSAGSRDDSNASVLANLFPSAN